MKTEKQPIQWLAILRQAPVQQFNGHTHKSDELISKHSMLAGM